MSEPGTAQTVPALANPWMRGVDMGERRCSVEGCVGPVHGRGLCSKHYQRLRAYGSVDSRRPTIEERFWAKVDKSGECWLWTAGLGIGGYGQFTGPGSRFAHRFSYELAYGHIPAGLTIDHVCHNEDRTCEGGPTCLHRRCVNPSHLAAVTQRENNLASKNTTTAKHAAVTHCPAGHPYDEANTIIYKGMRRCRSCANEGLRAWRQRNRDAPQRPCRVCGRPSRQGATECSACNMRRLRAGWKEAP